MKTQCHAIADSRHWVNENIKPVRCEQEATNTVNGRPLCWVHAHAAVNPARSKPLRFVGEVDLTNHGHKVT